MRVSVHSRGGVFGVDRTVLVADCAVEVTEEGVTRQAGRLDEATAGRLDDLALQLAATAPIVAGGGPAADSMATDIEIDDGAGQRHAISVRSGDDAPQEVWDLLTLVREASG